MTQICLSFFYIDLGNQWWKTACTEMLRSAKRVMPDAHIIQMSTKGTRMHPWADELVEVNLAEDAPHAGDMLSKIKGYAMAECAKRIQGPVIFTDADVIWTAKPPIHDSGATARDDTAEALEQRQFYIQKGQTEWPWGRFIRTLDALPPSTWKADATELALNFNFLPGDALSLSPADTQKFVHHFPGRPETMIAFARSLDKGEPFKEMDPTKPKLGVNEDLTSLVFTDKLTIPSASDIARAASVGKAL